MDIFNKVPNSIFIARHCSWFIISSDNYSAVKSYYNAFIIILMQPYLLGSSYSIPLFAYFGSFFGGCIYNYSLSFFTFLIMTASSS
jgi:hypothetical protein